MTQHKVHSYLQGRLLMVGCGSIGQAVLPLILRHLGVGPDRIEIVTADARGREVADHYGIRFTELALTPENYRHEIERRVDAGDFLLNLSVDVSSTAMARLCHERGVLYLDTVVEPWGGLYFDSHLTPAQRSNYALREGMLALRRELGPGPTAVSAQGANPGIVSQLAKEAALTVARDTGLPHQEPTTREGWARLFRDLGVKAIHIAERDTQTSATPKRPGEFVNTWSIDGFVSEGCQPAELGWGTHERQLPPGGRHHESGCGSAIYLQRPGAGTRVRTWTPLAGPFHGFLVTHNESISISDYLTLRDGDRGRLPPHRPLRLPPLRRCGAVAARDGRPQLAPAGRAAPDRRGDRHRRRRAGRPPHGPRARCLLVRLPALDRRGPRARPLQQRHLAPGGGRRAGRHGLGDREPAGRHRRGRRARPSNASSTSPDPISVPSSAPTATGPRSRAAASSSPRTRTRPIPGSSRTSSSPDTREGSPLPSRTRPTLAFGGS